MKNYAKAITRNLKITLATLWDDFKDRRDKTKWPYHGVHVYYGWQGSGKTASMVYHLKKAVQKFPRALISSNLDLKWLEPLRLQLTEAQYRAVATSMDKERTRKKLLTENLQGILSIIEPEKQYVLYEDAVELATIMHGVRRGDKGHVILADEIHLYMNSVKSKETTIETFAAISQLRKNRTLVIGTSQLVMRLEKAVREQMTTIIKCDTYWGVFTRQEVYDAHTLEWDSKQQKLIGDVIKGGFFIQTRELRRSYDTLQIVQPSEVLYEKSYNLQS